MLPPWHDTVYLNDMTRRFLLTASLATSFAALSSVAFSAAVVRMESTFLPNPGTSGKLIRWIEIERLAGKQMDVAAAPVTLESHRTGAWVTFVGVNPIASDANPAQPIELADHSGADATMFAVTSPNIDAASTTAAVPAAKENIGSASNFAAVPEPASISLIALGTLAFLRRRRG